MLKNAQIVAVGADPKKYHAQTAERGTEQFVMSSGALREFSGCPSRWRAGYQNPESSAKEWGSLLDCMITSPERFNSIYAVEPEFYTTRPADPKKAKAFKPEQKRWNNNATVCREWHEEQRAAGKEIADASLLAKCKAAIARLRADELAAEWLNSCDCQIWVQAEWHDKATGLVIPIKALLDFVPRAGTVFANCLGDFKTTRNASVMAWQRWCFTAGYHVQAAIYSDLYVEATKEDRNTWCFLVQENYEPYEVGKRMLSQDFTALGKATYTKMLQNYCQCLKHNRFPGYDDTDESIQGWSLVAPEPFMAERAMFAPQFSFGDGEEPEDQVPYEVGEDINV